MNKIEVIAAKLDAMHQMKNINTADGNYDSVIGRFFEYNDSLINQLTN